MRTPAPPPRRLLELAAAQEGLVSAAQCNALDVSAHRRARLVGAGSWTKVAHGVYDTEPTPLDVRRDEGRHDHLRRREVVRGLLAYGPEAIAVGASALVLSGARGLPLRLTPEITYPGARFGRSRDGIVVRQFEPGARLRVQRGLRFVEPELALAQAIPTLDRRTAVSLLDGCLNQRIVTFAGVARAHRLAAGRRNVRRTHPWWSLGVEESESVLESHARLDCLDAGVPPDKLQVAVHDGGRFLGRGDMGWLLPDGRWLVAEIDGVGIHSTLHALLRDRQRQNDLVAFGSTVVLRYTAADLREELAVGRSVRSVLHRLGRRVR